MDNIVIGIGELLWDMLPEGKQPGGAPANFAYHVSQFGLQSCVVSAVGHDKLGSELTARLDALAQRYDIAVLDDYPTGTVDVEVDDRGVPRYTIRENVAWDNIPFTPALESLARQAKAVCFGSLAQRNVTTRATIARLLDAIPRDASNLIVFDANLRGDFYSKDVLTESMRRCNILKINDEELAVVADMFSIASEDVDTACRAIIDKFNLRMLILTCGVNGSYIFSKENKSFQPTPIVEVADTVGAGDSFTAAFVASILKGKSVTEAHAVAVATSAYVCSCKGATPILPDSITGS